jgi:hypothetical protein
LKFWWISLIILISICPVFAKDRCQDYVTDERVMHTKYFGWSYPWWFGVGQIKQESACRSGITAFDGGMGLSQFMPATAKQMSKELGVILNPYFPQDSIRMQAYYMSKVHKNNRLEGSPYWVSYQAYNGGWKLLYKEYERAKSNNHDLMKLQCKRNVLKLKNGKLLDLCDVNYDYSQNVYKYGILYKPISSTDGRKQFWETSK